jgi:hypothetical protein
MAQKAKIHHPKTAQVNCHLQGGKPYILTNGKGNTFVTVKLFNSAGDTELTAATKTVLQDGPGNWKVLFTEIPDTVDHKYLVRVFDKKTGATKLDEYGPFAFKDLTRKGNLFLDYPLNGDTVCWTFPAYGRTDTNGPVYCDAADLDNNLTFHADALFDGPVVWVCQFALADDATTNGLKLKATKTTTDGADLILYQDSTSSVLVKNAGCD